MLFAATKIVRETGILILPLRLELLDEGYTILRYDKPDYDTRLYFQKSILSSKTFSS